MPEGPRVYNLFPLLAGPLARWREHLERAAALGFNWLYVNPVHYPGFSGSLYAVKDYYRLHPLLQGGEAVEADTALRRMLDDAHRLGLRVMMDLVVNHTGKDALLVEQHPDWYARKADGSIKSPGAVDPVDPTLVTEWGDLAEIDYHDKSHWPGLIDYFGAVAVHYAGLGCDGFRCDAAYQVPGEVWKGLIDRVRAVTPDALFAAETLGCRIEQIQQLKVAGFDYLFNSVKWWDFQAGWLLEQYEQTRRIAPSIGFPESHDTDRLAAELPPDADIAAHYRLRALFAAVFSAGWMIPMGFEYGFRRRLDVVGSRPEQWEAPSLDLTAFLTAVNRMKAGLPTLNEEGPIERLTHDQPLVALLKRGSGGRVLIAVNASETETHDLNLAGLLAPLGLNPAELRDVTPEANGRAPSHKLTVPPLGVKVLAEATNAEGTTVIHDQDSLTPHPAPGSAVGLPATTSQSILIEDVRPRLDDGRFAVKREVGDLLEVSADIFKDGHDKLAAVVRYRPKGASVWQEAPMRPWDNDRWGGAFRLERMGRWQYTVAAWVDAFESWRDEVGKKRAAGQMTATELAEGRLLIDAAFGRASRPDAERLDRLLREVDQAASDDDRADLMLSSMLRQIMARAPDRSRAVSHDRVYEVVVDQIAARYAAWYEMMPRSQGTDPTKSSTFLDCEKRLPEIRKMGFDVIYFTPIHPIGRIHRKGPNNSLTAGPHDPGSPYAIGSDEGGHKAVHPDLGGIEAFDHFVRTARDMGFQVALDFAINCAPDHPWVKAHPDWFIFRPDGTIKYAENPPKKYQDIVNVNFYGPHAPALWAELRDTFLHWVEHGVTIFRVDNPHTKPVPFWEWVIAEVQARHPEVIFLSEAFTRPKMMKMLAKVGFTQSYTYFTWRNFKREIEDYLTELAQGDSREYFRPNFFPTTPDILPPYLQTGGRPAFLIRFALAALLSSVYGMYNGYELCEGEGLPGKEEYANSEKYQFKVWDWNRPGNIKAEITRLNKIRRENPALHEFENLRFHASSDDNVLFFSKVTPDRSNMIFVAVNLDPFDAHDSVLAFPLDLMGVPGGETFEVEELLTGTRHLWRGGSQTVRLDPAKTPVAVFRVTVWTSVDYRSPCD